MAQNIVAAVLMLAAGLAFGGQPVVTFESLLSEMIDREAMARLPEPAYTCHQFSSYDRRSKTPDDPGGWFANEDWSSFVRSEQVGDRTEWVMMDAEGPGAVVRFWSGGPKPKGVLRVYLDGAEAPVIEGPTDAIVGGTALAKAPFSAVRSRGLNLYLPIPYAKRCKITYDGPNWRQTRADPDRIWFNINYRTYAPGTAVRTFSRADFEAAAELIASTGEALLDPSGRVAPATATEATGTLRSGEALDTRLEGPAAARKLSVRLQADDLRRALRSTVLVVECDGERTVWCPAGDFFGSGVGLNPFRGWWRVVGEDGWMTCFWPMPFAKACRVRLVNYGAEDVKAELSVGRGDWRWDERSMHFHTAWRHEHPVPTRPFSDWNYVEVQGRGVYVGDTLAVMNPVPIWWGEGDEKISVDGEAFPSHFGTGTEDYYGYAYGHPAFFEAPFHAQPNVDGPGNQGHTTVTRTRGLDAIPFGESLRVDMEVWHWREVEMAYAAATYWYARPGATCNREPEPHEATRPIPGPPEPKRVKGALEGEELEVIEKTGGVTEIQRNPTHGWSGNAHLWWRDAKPGETLTLAIPVAKAGRYKVVVRLTKSYDYAIVQFHLDGEKLGEPLDLYSPKPVSDDPIALGTRELAAGEHKLTLEIAGTNPKSKPRHMAGLDYVKLAPRAARP